jgi:hypothetical protein
MNHIYILTFRIFFKFTNKESKDRIRRKLDEQKGRKNMLNENITQEAKDHSEGIVARTIETQTAKIPSDVFLYGALGSIALSLYFEMNGNPEKSRFIGQWVSPFLLLGVYNKLVKIAGSDRVHVK